MELVARAGPSGGDEHVLASLSQALTSFAVPETLDEANSYRCPTCAKLVRARKQVTVRLTPASLILHLKRFGQGARRGSKLSHHVAFDETLDLARALPVGHRGGHAHALHADGRAGAHWLQCPLGPLHGLRAYAQPMVPIYPDSAAALQALQAGQQQHAAALQALQAGQQQHTAVLQALQAGQQALVAQVAAIAQQLQAFAAHAGVPIGAAAIVAERVAIARAANHHTREEDLYVTVPLSPSGLAPALWPQNFNRTVLRSLPGAAIVALLVAYQLAIDGTVLQKRNRLAVHIGTVTF